MDATGWDDRYRAADRLWSAEPNVFVESRLADRRPGMGLDLASGEGRNAIWLAERGWEMTAVDFSSVAVERGRQHSDSVDFVVGDVNTWRPGRKFDLVLVAYLHLPRVDFDPLIRRAATWLRSGGELFMIGHDRTNIDHGVGGPQHPEVLWDVDPIVSWLDGLDIVEAGVVERDVTVDDGVTVALDALIRAHRPELEATVVIGKTAQPVDPGWLREDPHQIVAFRDRGTGRIGDCGPPDTPPDVLHGVGLAHCPPAGHCPSLQFQTHPSGPSHRGIDLLIDRWCGHGQEHGQAGGESSDRKDPDVRGRPSITLSEGPGRGPRSGPQHPRGQRRA